MNIIYDEVANKWRLVSILLTIPRNKKIITITDKDIKQNNEIIILKNRGEYEFRHHNDTDLLLTNMFTNVTETELYIVLFSQFFQNSSFKEKILSLNLTFLDETLSLREYVNDPSYYYLGIALFFLPQLPLLLEHVGIPVTAYVSKALEKLSQLFIFQSLLEQCKPTADESRVMQHNLELQAAKQRVAKGSTRVATVVKPLSLITLV